MDITVNFMERSHTCMDLSKINEIAYRTMGNRKSHQRREKGYIYYHGQRVAQISLNLRRELFPDDDSMDDLIYVGALFHDVTKGIEPHHETGAHMVKQLLKDECTSEQLDIISDIIANHNARHHENLPFYIKIVQDADILDHFGTMDLWITLLHSAYEEENVFDVIRFWESAKCTGFITYSRNAIHYELSKQIFEQKVSFVKQFQERFRHEANGQIHYL